MKIATIEKFEGIYKILEESFPEDEYRSYEGQKELFKNPKYTVHICQDEGMVYSFLATWSFEDFVYGEHMAVSKEVRNRGTGKKMILAAAEDARKVGKAFCLEVEPPTEEMAKRRIEFYKRIGFVLNEYPYMQPSLGEGKNPIALMIMSYKEPLTKETFENIRKVLYREVYKVEE